MDWKETAVRCNAGREGFSNWVAVGSEPAHPPHHDRAESLAPRLWGWSGHCDCLGQQNVVTSGSAPGETGWDPGSLLECLRLDKVLLQEQIQRNYNGLKRTAGRHSWGQV